MEMKSPVETRSLLLFYPLSQESQLAEYPKAERQSMAWSRHFRHQWRDEE